MLMRDYFAQHSFEVEAVHDGRAGLARALAGEHDLILLDALLPVVNGLEVLRQLRKQRSSHHAERPHGAAGSRRRPERGRG